MTILTAEEVERYKEFSFSDGDERLPPRITFMTPRRRSAYQMAEAAVRKKGYETLPYYFASRYHVDRKHLTEIRQETNLKRDDIHYLMYCCDIPARDAKKTRSVGDGEGNNESQIIEACVRKIEAHVEHILELERQDLGEIPAAKNICNLTPDQQRRVVDLYHTYEAGTRATGLIIRKISEETGIEKSNVSRFLQAVEI